ncbi:unnamed protein product [Cunninghamella blakesleeana]
MKMYQIKPYNTVQAFLKETEHLLENNVILNTFPLWASTDLAMVKDNPHPQYYNSVWKSEGKELVYVFACVNNTMYLGWCGRDCQQDHHQTPPDLKTPELQVIFQSILKDCYEKIGNTLEYIHGYTSLAFCIYEQWKLITMPHYDKTSLDQQSAYQHPSSLSVWCFELTSPQQLIYKESTLQLLPKTYLRLATMDDLDLLTDWVQKFMLDSNMPLNDGEAREMSQIDIEKKNAYLWCDLTTHQPLGTIWKRRSLKKLTISLAYVFVPKEYRSKGYAAAMVTQLSLLLFNDEKINQYQSLTLLMDGKRDPLKNLYASIGYHPIGSFARLHL